MDSDSYGRIIAHWTNAVWIPAAGFDDGGFSHDAITKQSLLYCGISKGCCYVFDIAAGAIELYDPTNQPDHAAFFVHARELVARVFPYLAFREIVNMSPRHAAANPDCPLGDAEGMALAFAACRCRGEAPAFEAEPHSRIEKEIVEWDAWKPPDAAVFDNNKAFQAALVNTYGKPNVAAAKEQLCCWPGGRSYQDISASDLAPLWPKNP